MKNLRLHNVSIHRFFSQKQNKLHKNKNICNHIIIKNIFGAQNIGSICVIKELLNKGNVSFIFKSDWK